LRVVWGRRLLLYPASVFNVEMIIIIKINTITTTNRALCLPSLCEVLSNFPFCLQTNTDITFSATVSNTFNFCTAVINLKSVNVVGKF